jgi:hypothetical protein
MTTESPFTGATAGRNDGCVTGAGKAPGMAAL